MPSVLKTLFLLFAVAWVSFLWHKHAVATRAPEGSDYIGSDAVVISFSSNQELIERLRQVKTGQKVDLRPVVTVQREPTGTGGSDAAARAAYVERTNRAQEEEHKVIAAELARIHGSQE
ncbi:MAG TPA: hypothetical protein VN775_08215 [Opitutaceae bacterium]|nr:hypothetical protein [Opitutaceae bacterium]